MKKVCLFLGLALVIGFASDRVVASSGGVGTCYPLQFCTGTPYAHDVPQSYCAGYGSWSDDHFDGACYNN